MRILVVHNYYQVPGGEDKVFESEVEMLKSNGHDVKTYTVTNDSISGFKDKVKTFLNVVFSITQYKKVSSAINDFKPDIVHVHNYFPLISPAVFFACKNMKVPVVHTLHNYRAVCPTSLLMHEGQIIERSINKNSWWAVRKRVYKGSFVGSLSLFLMVELHKLIGTWNTKVDAYIALTKFSKEKYIEAGWPESKITVKPNFVEPLVAKENLNNECSYDDYAIFVGRMSEEKGIAILLKAWENCNINLLVIGDGPLRDKLASCKNSKIKYLGQQSKTETIKYIKNSKFLVMTSTWYETFGMVVIEAFACGKPVIVPKLGSLKTLVTDMSNGLHFEAGNSKDLCSKINLLSENEQLAIKMGSNARDEFCTKYTKDVNYRLLLDLYNKILES